jgi:hypothetical protein
MRYFVVYLLILLCSPSFSILNREIMKLDCLYYVYYTLSSTLLYSFCIGKRNEHECHDEICYGIWLCPVPFTHVLKGQHYPFFT